MRGGVRLSLRLEISGGGSCHDPSRMYASDDLRNDASQACHGTAGQHNCSMSTSKFNDSTSSSASSRSADTLCDEDGAGVLTTQVDREDGRASKDKVDPEVQGRRRRMPRMRRMPRLL